MNPNTPGSWQVITGSLGRSINQGVIKGIIFNSNISPTFKAYHGLRIRETRAKHTIHMLFYQKSLNTPKLQIKTSRPWIPLKRFSGASKELPMSLPAHSRIAFFLKNPKTSSLFDLLYFSEKFFA